MRARALGGYECNVANAMMRKWLWQFCGTV